ncbi:hypothetical protein Vadar_004457 [Vaccinium darrowii]|uniref:Uncharacterized protein n=1 Tax=Vaccinium darrowii TaxID=229202 RepID=A0ACB7YC24_9ERIC|nr:hypothetical protein Vadar_004457 [Vaccinium darrowii]
MEEEILNRIASFVLTSEEDKEVEILAEDFKASKHECLHSVMGKIITQKGINLAGLKAAMESVWGYPKGFKVMEIGGGIYQVVFGNKMDLLRVLAGNPWLYNNQLIVLQRWSEGVLPDEINFSYSPFWIQLWGMPLEFMSIDVGKRMMDGFGDVQQVSIAQLSGNQGRCVRVKVELDLQKPLPRGKKVYTVDWNLIRVSFRYEKLLILCYYCGVVGHDDHACMVKHHEVKAGVMKENQYGGWLRASPVKLPPRRRGEGQPDTSPAESSAERSDFGMFDDHGNDLHDPRKSGNFVKGKPQLLGELNSKGDENRVGKEGQVGGGPFENEMSKMACPRFEPVTPKIGPKKVVHKEAHADGSQVSPVQNMEEDPITFISSKSIEVASQSIQAEAIIPISEQGVRGESKKQKKSSKVQQMGKGDERSKKNSTLRGYNRKLPSIGNSFVGMEKESKRGTAIPGKRKCNEGWDEVLITEIANQKQQKKHKLGVNQDEVINVVVVEEASPNWPQGAR